MRPFLALLQDDLSSMVRSWVIRIWLFFSLILAVVTLMAGSGLHDSSAQVLAWALTAYLVMASFVVIILSAGATSSELPYLGDGIMSRGIAPLHYVLAKLISRGLTAFALFVIVAAPMAAIMAAGGDADLSRGGLAVGLAYTSLVILLLAFLGVTFSTFIPNALVALVILMILWYVGVSSFAYVQSTELSAEGLLAGFPSLLRGDFDLTYHVRIIGAMIVPLVLLPFVSVWIFQRRDL